MGSEDGGGFVDGERAVEKENKELNKPPQEGAGLAKDSRSKRGPSSKKSIHPAEKTTTQISHQEFISFTEGYFEEINEEKFSRIISPTEIDHKWLNEMTKYDKCYEKYQEALVRNLIGCLINEESVAVSEEEVSGRVEMVEATVFGENDGSEFFIQNEILETFSNNYVEGLIEAYKRQVAVNNVRRRILGEKLKERLVYPAYWAALRTINMEIDNVFVRRKRYKKKRNDFDDELIREMLEKHESFYELFGDISRLEEDYRDYEDLFDPEDNVDAKFYGVEPYDYFS